MFLLKLILGIKNDVCLAPYTAFKIGGPAKYFCVLKNKNKLPLLFFWARKKKIPLFIIGGGNNLLVSDKGYSGLVILMRAGKIKLKDDNIIAEAGVLLSRILNFCLKHNLEGMEWVAGIPGTVGGAVVGNAGAFGGAMADLIDKVKVLEISGRKAGFIILNKEQLGLSYRDSIFKKKRGEYIITKVWLRNFQKNGSQSRKITKEFLEKRRISQPQEASAGSVFKNFTLSQNENSDVEQSSIPAGFLIEKSGLKGCQIGGAQISLKHANFIINKSNAKARDVVGLILLAKKRIKQKFNIDLEEEIQYLGFSE